jgi:hypothetical protein
LDTSSQFFVKGVWFTTARRYVLERHGEDILARVAEEMPDAMRDALTAPLASHWYPEEALQHGMRAIHHVVADGDSDRFVAIMQACTELGVSHFFRALIRLGTPAMVLRKVPAMWKLIRRGPAATIVVDADAARAVVSYADFPYFDDPNYRSLTVGSLRAVTWICARRMPRVEIVRHSRDALSVIVRYGA